MHLSQYPARYWRRLILQLPEPTHRTCTCNKKQQPCTTSALSLPSESKVGRTLSQVRDRLTNRLTDSLHYRYIHRNSPHLIIQKVEQLAIIIKRVKLHTSNTHKNVLQLTATNTSPNSKSSKKTFCRVYAKYG